MISEIKSVNLNQKEFPNILLTGNGMFRKDGFSWAELLKKTAENRASVDKYNSGDEFKIPYTILTIATGQQVDAKRIKTYEDVLSKITYQKNEFARKLLAMPFDAILTTNYTFEWEFACDNEYPNYSENKRNGCVRKKLPRKALDKKYRIHSFNQVANGPEIWHIHGDKRIPSSIVLTHEEYAKLIRNVVDYSDSRGKDYANNTENFRIKSWIDYLTVGNIFILGYSLDFAEFDIWWLINRRLREKRSIIGDIYFYEPYKATCTPKIDVLRDIGVKCIDLGFEIKDSDDKNKKYQMFYEAAIEDIKCRLIDMKDNINGSI